MSGWPIWYELMCSDVAGVRSFYQETLGWDIPAEGQPMPNGGEYRTIARADGGSAGGVLTLTEAKSGMGMDSAWYPYFHADDVDALASRVTALGGAVHLPPTDMPGAGRIAMVSDPQGALFYLIKPTPPAGQPDAKSDVFAVKDAGHCRWNELNTTDAKAALAFYTDLFDWTAGYAMPMGAAGDYQFFDMDGVTLGAINPMVPPGTKAHWTLAFGVGDIDSAVAAANASGGTFNSEIHLVPTGDHVTYGTDPSGAQLIFTGSRGARS